MHRLLILLPFTVLLLASCQQSGVPVPAEFPLKLSLPAGSEITDSRTSPAGGAIETAVFLVSFTCPESEDQVISHISRQLLKMGFSEKESLGAAITASFSEDGTNNRVYFGKAGETYMLTYTQMP